ncbi:MAG: DUF3592 domain-containing protein [Acidobacteria bacterium]|nr:DUF3592 domain-containing protein [Acidobacteriota bacterium]
MNFLVEYLAYGLVFTGAVLVLLGLLLWLRREKPTATELERRRRLKLNRIGRIAQGQIVELQDGTSPHGVGRLVVYNYEVRGVEYQAAQDISFFQQRLDLSRVAAGQAASVKYDPQNPTNSIVLSEEWSGV